jgi:hypothetical protein
MVKDTINMINAHENESGKAVLIYGSTKPIYRNGLEIFSGEHIYTMKTYCCAGTTKCSRKYFYWNQKV